MAQRLGWLSVTLWALGMLRLLQGAGTFRPRIALLHGLAVAAAGGALATLHPPVRVMAAAGAAVGALGAWGHSLAPGLWVGLGFLGATALALPPQRPVAIGFALAAEIAVAVSVVFKRMGRP